MVQPDAQPSSDSGSKPALPELEPESGDNPVAAAEPASDTVVEPPPLTLERPATRQVQPMRKPASTGSAPRVDDSFDADLHDAPATELQPVDDDENDTVADTSAAAPGRSTSVRAPGWDHTVPPQPAQQRDSGRVRKPDSAPELKPEPSAPRPAAQQRPTDRNVTQDKQRPLTGRIAHSPVDEAARELARAALAAEIEKEEKAAMRGFQAEDGEIPPSPEVAKRFDVILQLGRGGMGIVYLCRDPRREGKVVAVKDIRAEIKSGMKVEQRVEHEARLLKELDHPGIVKVYDFLKFPRGSAIVMEFIDGLPLDHEIGAGRRITWDFGVRVLKNIGLALGYAHDKGVIHRDIKPDNILFSERHNIMKLLDFGLARIYDDPVEAHLTRTGMVVGTPHYMSPEQVSGKVLDQRSDIYSFGATLYYLITGQRHVDGSNVMDILEQQRSKPIIPPSHLQRDIPAWVSYIIGKMMEIKLEDRYESMAAILADVQKAELNPNGFVTRPPRGNVRRFNGLPLTPPQTEAAPQGAPTEDIREELPTGDAQKRPTAKQSATKRPTLVPPVATSTQRAHAAARGVLELLEDDQQLTVQEMSGLLREISGRLERAEKQRISPGMLLVMVMLSTLVVVLAVLGLLLLLQRGPLA